MRANELLKSPVVDLAKKLPSLADRDQRTISDLVKDVASRHHITDKALHALFLRKYKRDPYHWKASSLDETETPSTNNEQIDEFVAWSCNILHIQQPWPEITLSHDTEDAQTNHHTGSNVPSENKIWVYVANRNMIDIFRTIFHELVHTRQGQLNMIKAGDSYPGSPIEAMADMLAGKYIKIYGKDHPEIFE